MEKIGFRLGETADLRRIRAKLPRGALTKIAEQLHTSARIVGEVFEHGWHSQYKVAATACALELIQRDIDGQKSLTAMAKKLDLTTTNLQSIPYQHKKKGLRPAVKSGKGLNLVGKVVLGVVAIGAFLVLGGGKLFPKTQ